MASVMLRPTAARPLGLATFSLNLPRHPAIVSNIGAHDATNPRDVIGAQGCRRGLREDVLEPCAARGDDHDVVSHVDKPTFLQQFARRGVRRVNVSKNTADIRT
eukprot:m.1229062 g.1229062  ORF g.1229062 m.1229062 type:complete len:104 (+) comp24649_c0_seq26:2164-2475(+)